MNDRDLTREDEEYIKLIGNNVIGNRYLYQLIQLQLLQKSSSNVKAKMLIWTRMAPKGTSDHKSKQAVNQETYLKEYIDKRLLSQISFE